MSEKKKNSQGPKKKHFVRPSERLQNYRSRPFQKSVSLVHWKQNNKKKCGVTPKFSKNDLPGE